MEKKEFCFYVWQNIKQHDALEQHDIFYVWVNYSFKQMTVYMYVYSTDQAVHRLMFYHQSAFHSLSSSIPARTGLKVMGHKQRHIFRYENMPPKTCQENKKRCFFLRPNWKNFKQSLLSRRLIFYETNIWTFWPSYLWVIWNIMSTWWITVSKSPIK